MKFGKKITLILSFLTFLPILVFFVFYIFNQQNKTTDLILQRQKNLIELEANIFNDFLNDSKSDLFYLKGLTSFNALLNSPLNSDEYQANLLNVQNDFLAMSNSNNQYYQVRYINEFGEEVVRVDRVEDSVSVIPFRQLQYKGDRPYFNQTKNLPLNEVYLSPLDLNIEQGKLENRGTNENPIYVPVLRFATPVYNNNEFKGIIINNLYAKDLLNRLVEINSGLDFFALINSDGNYLLHPNKNRAFQYLQKEDCRCFDDDYPQIYSKVILNKNSTQQFYSDEEGVYVTSLAVNPYKILGQNNTDYYWYLVEFYKPNFVGLQALGVSFIAIFVLFVLFTSFAFRLLIKSYVNPLEQITNGIVQFSKGNYKYQIKSNTKNELSLVINSLNKLSQKLLQSEEDLQNKVNEQTKKLKVSEQKLSKQKMALINVLEDVEEEKQNAQVLATDLRKFKLAVDNAYDHVVITDVDGSILYANRAVTKTTGFSSEEVLGTKAGVLWGGLMPKPFYKKMWDTIKVKKKPFVGEITNKRKNGEEYTALATISPVMGEGGKKIEYFVGIERDISKEKQVDKMKTEFISLASHQLRTPLSAMKWFLEMLLDGDAGKLTKKQGEYVKNVDESNERMIKLVNSLLNVSRIESGRIIVDPKPTNLKSLIDNLVKELQPKIKQKNIKVIVSVAKNLKPVKVDEKLIRNVYLNLLTNAIKYTDNKGEVHIFISTKGKDIISQVSDTGVGIPKEDQKNIFKKFFRASNVTKLDTDGNGLGMYLAKAIVESSGGKIWFKSKKGKGTTFWFTIPKKGVKPKKGEVKIDS